MAIDRDLAMPRLARIACPNCPRELQFRPEYAGRKVACRYCGFPFRLPTHVTIVCPECRHEGLVRSEYLGRKTRCKACSHAFRALARRSSPEPSRPPLPDAAEAWIERLHQEIARRDQALAEAYEELNLARRQIADLRDRGREPLAIEPDEPETADDDLTNEWAVIDDDSPEPDDLTASDLAHGTQFEILGPDLLGIDDEGLPPIADRRSSSDPDASLLATMRAECDRLRGELAELREQTDQAVFDSDSREILEKSLAIARNDAVRLRAERDEARRMLETTRRELDDQIRSLRADLAEAHERIRILDESPPPALPQPRIPGGSQSQDSPEITPDTFYEMARERDQARRELNRLRSVLDRMGQ